MSRPMLKEKVIASNGTHELVATGWYGKTGGIGTGQPAFIRNKESKEVIIKKINVYDGIELLEGKVDR